MFKICKNIKEKENVELTRKFKHISYQMYKVTG